MKVVGWEEKRGSIKTGQLGTGFLGQGFSPGSRVYSFRKFPRLSLPITEDFIPRYPAYYYACAYRTVPTSRQWCHAPHCFGSFFLAVTCFYILVV